MPRFDRHRIFAFLKFTARRFVEDRCLQTAGALAYTSLFALVPLTAVTFAVLSRFPAFAQWHDRITHFVFMNFVPATGDVVQRYLTEFADNASKATAIGIAVLILSAVMLMLSVEDAFNRIWRVQDRRPARTRFVVYWAVLTLVPLLLGVALALSSYLFALPLLHAADLEFTFKTYVLGALPFLLEWVVLAAAYVWIPNRSVRLRDAAIGALVAAILFELTKRGFAAYVTSGANYEQVYGTLAIIPIFILWIYLCWILVLLGASLTAIIAAFDYRPSAERLAPGEEFFGLVRVLAHFAAAQREGRGLHSAHFCDSEPMLTDDLVQSYLAELERIGMIQRNDASEWLLVRNLSAVDLYVIYASSSFRLPMAGPRMRTSPDAPDGPAIELVERCAAMLRDQLAVPLAEIFPAPARSEMTTSTKESLA
ncbi:MAG TPA: virulence factor BrkB family protein [Rudaea sp.]|nr:virulence factor BrkB family protein [Rudaea sp.]